MPTEDDDLLKMVADLNEQRSQLRARLIEERAALKKRVDELSEAIEKLSESVARPALASTSPPAKQSRSFAEDVYQAMLPTPGHTTTVGHIATVIMLTLDHPKPKDASLRARVYKALWNNPTMFRKAATYGKWVAVPRKE